VIFGVPPKIRVAIHENLRQREGSIRSHVFAGINFRHYPAPVRFDYGGGTFILRRMRMSFRFPCSRSYQIKVSSGLLARPRRGMRGAQAWPALRGDHGWQRR